jgi:hypothetical protein
MSRRLKIIKGHKDVNDINQDIIIDTFDCQSEERELSSRGAKKAFENPGLLTQDTRFSDDTNAKDIIIDSFESTIGANYSCLYVQYDIMMNNLDQSCSKV